MLKRLIPFFVIIVFSLGLAGYQYARHKDDPLQADEAAWIFTTVYWTHFIHGDFFHPDWKSTHDLTDHPPMAKYYYGAILNLRGWNEKTVTNLNFWLSQSTSPHREQYNRKLNELARKERLLLAKAGASLLLVLLAASAYMLGAAIGGARLGAIFSVVMLLNGSALRLSQLVLSDLLLVSLVMFDTAILIIWSRRWLEENGQKTWSVAVAAGIVLALTSLTRLNGMIQVGAALVFVATLAASSPQSRGAIIRQSLAMGALAGLAMLFLNPAFLNDSHALFNMLKFRHGELAHIEQWNGPSQVPLCDRIMFALNLGIRDSGLNRTKNGFPIGLAFMVIGSMASLHVLVLRRSRWKYVVGSCLLLSSLLWAGPTIWSFKKSLNARYLFPLAPWLGIIMAIGIDQTIDFFRDPIARQRLTWAMIRERRSWFLVILLFFLLWNLFSMVGRSHARSLDFQATQMERALALHPNDIAQRLQLVEKYLALNRDADAITVLTPAIETMPDNKLARALLKVLEERTNPTRPQSDEQPSSPP